MILEGTTSSGAVVPVQVTADGKVVAEGLQGPQGPQGPEGPEGPPGPAGGLWTQTGVALYPTDGTAEVNLDAPLRFANLVAEYGYVDVELDPNGGGGRFSVGTMPNGGSVSLARFWVNNTGRAFISADSDCLSVSSVSGSASNNALINGRHSGSAGVPDSGTMCFLVRTDGNVQNTNNSYGSLSDLRLKENIADASSQWADIKALRLVNYNLKSGVGDGRRQLGLIAQEVETICPGLVSEDDSIEPGTKSVAYSVLYLKAVGALQEAMNRVEQLEKSLADITMKLSSIKG